MEQRRLLDAVADVEPAVLVERVVPEVPVGAAGVAVRPAAGDELDLDGARAGRIGRLGSYNFV